MCNIQWTVVKHKKQKLYVYVFTEYYNIVKYVIGCLGTFNKQHENQLNPSIQSVFHGRTINRAIQMHINLSRKNYLFYYGKFK